MNEEAQQDEWENCFEFTIGHWCRHVEHKPNPQGGWFGKVISSYADHSR